MSGNLKNLYENAFYIKEELNRGRAKLSFVPAICGIDYIKAPRKIMVVGRAPNGWSMQAYSPKHDSTIGGWFDARLSWVYRDGPGTHRKSIARSKFWQFIRYKLLKDGIIQDKLHFCDGIVWTNLMKISDQESGNPNDMLCEQTVEIMDQIMKAEIEYYKPDEIWFVTKKNTKENKLWGNDNDEDNWLFWQLDSGKKAFKLTLDYIIEKDICARLFYRPERRKFSEIDEGICVKDILFNSECR